MATHNYLQEHKNLFNKKHRLVPGWFSKRHHAIRSREETLQRWIKDLGRDYALLFTQGFGLLERPAFYALPETIDGKAVLQMWEGRVLAYNPAKRSSEAYEVIQGALLGGKQFLRGKHSEDLEDSIQGINTIFNLIYGYVLLPTHYPAFYIDVCIIMETLRNMATFCDWEYLIGQIEAAWYTQFQTIVAGLEDFFESPIISCLFRQLLRRCNVTAVPLTAFYRTLDTSFLGGTRFCACGTCRCLPLQGDITVRFVSNLQNQYFFLDLLRYMATWRRPRDYGKKLRLTMVNGISKEIQTWLQDRLQLRHETSLLFHASQFERHFLKALVRMLRHQPLERHAIACYHEYARDIRIRKNINCTARVHMTRELFFSWFDIVLECALWTTLRLK